MELQPPKPREQLTERTVEYAFALEQLPLVKGRNVLDVGIGPNPALWYMLNTMGYHCLGIDLKKRTDHPLATIDDIVAKDYDTPVFDAVFCISTLEHIAEYMKAVENMAKLTKPGGIVVLTFPYSREYIANTVEGHYTQSFSRKNVYEISALIGEKMLAMKWWHCWTGKQWRDGERVSFPEVCSEPLADLIGMVVRKC